MIIQESLILEQKKLKISAGLVIIQDDKILLVHPTGSKWYGTYSIPKGHVEKGENLWTTALRETKEEVGIDINKDDVVGGPYFIDYTHTHKNIRRDLSYKEKLYKKVYYYIVIPSIPILQENLILQKSEVDWAGFMTRNDAERRIHWRFKKLLDFSFNFIDWNYNVMPKLLRKPKNK